MLDNTSASIVSADGGGVGRDFLVLLNLCKFPRVVEMTRLLLFAGSSSALAVAGIIGRAEWRVAVKWVEKLMMKRREIERKKKREEGVRSGV